MIIFKGMVEQERLRKELEKLNGQIDLFKRCGLEPEAKKLLPRYNEIVGRIKALDEVIYRQRRKSSHALLVCFVAADLATLAADQFADVCKEVNYGMNSADNEFVRLMKFNAESSAERWNEVVRLIDEGGQDINLSNFYADFSEEITDRVLPLINDSVRDVMENTKKGRNWL